MWIQYAFRGRHHTRLFLAFFLLFFATSMPLFARAEGASNGSPINATGGDVERLVQPPLWRSWWAYAFYIGAAGLVYSLILRTVFERGFARERKRLLESASVSDPLTQLKNRRYLLEHLPPDVAIVLRHYEQGGFDSLASQTDKQLIFFMIDVDNFKKINDTYGYSAGDNILKEFAQVMQSIFRQSDYLIRWGGEEFLVVGRFMNIETAYTLSERLRDKVSETAFTSGENLTVNITCSIGFSAFPFDKKQPNALDWEQVVGLADASLYAAKLSGRNRWVGLRSGDTFNWRTDVKDLLANIPTLIKSKALETNVSADQKELLKWPVKKAKLHA
jgi:diguanylate cyclase (GGDEF)-like protein